MLALTPLNKLLGVSVGISIVLVYLFGSSCPTVVPVLLLLVGAVMCNAGPKDKTLTTMDRFLINLDRVVQSKAPTSGQISGCLYIKTADLPTAAEIHEVMERVCETMPKYRSVAVRAPSVQDSTWRSSPLREMDWDYHITTHDESESLEAQLNALINVSIDPDKPLWRIDIVPGQEDGMGCVLVRVSHAMADGMRLIKCASQFLMFEDGTPVELAILAKMSKAKLAKMMAQKLDPVAFAKDLVTAATLADIAPESPSCFHAPASLFPNGPRLHVSGSVDFELIKTIKASGPVGTTINDVVLAAFCGALRRYSEQQHDEKLDGKLLRALCAVSLPDSPGRGPTELYNNFIMPSMVLPTDGKTPEERLALAHETMAVLKQSKVGWLIGQLTSILGALGLDAVAGQAQVKLFSKHSFVYSNVPCFAQPAYAFVQRAKIERFGVYYANMISQLLFLSYCGRLSMSLSTDTSVVKYPDRLIQAFVDEVEEWANKG